MAKRVCDRKFMVEQPELQEFGLKSRDVGFAVDYVHDVLDSIDSKLIEGGGERLSELVELANLSAIIGNLFRGGIVKATDGNFAANAPHTYPDLLGKGRNCHDIEIKVSLELNKPKGHLIKPGAHITLRYVLADDKGSFTAGKTNRGNVAWIWEVRAGWLRDGHFNFSSTEGDSGKTAVINAIGMEALKVVYCDLDRTPLSKRHRNFAKVTALFQKKAK